MARPALKLYRYKPLAADEDFRLLKLNPAQNHSDEIVCQLVAYKLPSSIANAPSTTNPGSAESTPKYEALSWCWGDEPPSISIRIHSDDKDFRFEIKPNLDGALRSLRDIAEVRLLWIDALCMNQEDKDERNAQVPRMKDFYLQAYRVCVWVGPSGDASDLALELVRDEILDVWKFDKTFKDGKMKEGWIAFWKLLQRQWFFRRWVIQEIALARRARLYCGGKYVEWDEFAHAVSLFMEVAHQMSPLLRRRNASNDDDDDTQDEELFSHARELGAAVLIDATSNLFRNSRDGRKQPLLSLEYLVSKYNVFEATQPRDTIYALLSIARDTTPKLPARASQAGMYGPSSALRLFSELGRRKIISQSYRVDYRLPVIEVYKDFVEFAIRQSEPTRALDILCRPWARPFTGEDDHTDLFGASVKKHGDDLNSTVISDKDDYQAISLPSWIAVRTSMPYVIAPISGASNAPSRVKRINADPLVGLPSSGQRNYTASGSIGLSARSLKFQKGFTSYSLFVSGFILDRIAKVEESSQLGCIPVRWFNTASWLDRNSDPPESLWRTLVANRGPNNSNPPPYYPRACKEAVSKLLSGEVLDTTEVISKGKSAVVAKFLRRVQAVIWGRSMIKTKQNRLGLAPKNTAEGDYVCILYGCSVPVLLRKVEHINDEDPEHKFQNENEQEEKKKKAVQMIENWRERQLLNRVTTDKLQHAATIRRSTTMFRRLWLLYLAVYYYVKFRYTRPIDVTEKVLDDNSLVEASSGSLWSPSSRSVTAPVEPVFLLVALCTTSPEQMKVLTPAFLQGYGQTWWTLIGHPPVARILLASFGSRLLVEWQCVPFHFGLIVTLTSLFFPRLILVTVGLQNLTFPHQIPHTLYKILQNSIKRARASAKISIASIWRLPSGRRIVQGYFMTYLIPILISLAFPFKLSKLHTAYKQGTWLSYDFIQIVDILIFVISLFVVALLPQAESASRLHKTEGLNNEWTQPNMRKHYHWIMIGECYVDGMMDGEAVDWQSNTLTNVAETRAAAKQMDVESPDLESELRELQTNAQRQIFELR